MSRFWTQTPSSAATAFMGLDGVKQWLESDEEVPDHIVIDKEVPDEYLVDTDGATATITQYKVWWRFYFDVDTFIETKPLKRLEIEELLKQVEG